MTPLTATNEKIYLNSVEYAHPAHVQFINDMQARSHAIKLHKKYGYAGPSVIVKDPSKILEHTQVKCTSVVYAGTTGYLVFPSTTDPVLEFFIKSNPWL